MGETVQWGMGEVVVRNGREESVNMMDIDTNTHTDRME